MAATLRRILVTGAGGFIGGHLVRDLIKQGYTHVRAVDCKPLDQWHQCFPDVDNRQLNLQLKDACAGAVEGIDEVYNLASDMGGMGFIESNRALCMLNVLINTHMLTAVQAAGVERYFFASSACVYSAEKQTSSNVTALKEEDAYPALPEDGYGWEKLFSERMCRHFREDFGLTTRVARYHNVYGPNGAFEGGREKAPSAICRKVMQARLSGVHEIEIWGDGEQTRSFTFIDDCVQGTQMIQHSDIVEPINLGNSQLVSINQLVSLAERFAGIKLKRKYNLNAPTGVRGRNSDNTMILARLGWQPSISLEAGLEQTYRWIYDQLRARQ